jgi:2-dehydropantoate 2-reductase
MRVVVVGAGAIGGLVGAHLARAGHDVAFVEVDERHVAAMREGGLRVSGAADFTVRAPVYLPSEMPDGLGTVLLAVKSRHTGDALESIAPRLAADGVVVSLQNGLEEYRIAAAVGAARTMGAFLSFGGYYAEPGHVVYAGPGSFRVGELDGARSSRCAALADALAAAFHPVEVTDNIFGYLWGKEALGAFYFATALVSEDVPVMIDRREYRPVYGALVGEVASVARAEGVRCEVIDGFDPLVFLRAAGGSVEAEPCWAAQKAYWGDHVQGRTGVWRDLAIHHRPTEVDTIITPIAERARARGVPVPRLERLIHLIHEAEQGRRQLGWHNLDDLAAVPVP